MKAGVAINPHTRTELLGDIICDVDQILIMSVNPGFGGQHFIDHTYQKIREVKKMLHDCGLNVLIEIDGGVTLENAAAIIHAGANVLVAGNTVFSSPDPKKVISQLEECVTNLRITLWDLAISSRLVLGQLSIFHYHIFCFQASVILLNILESHL